MIGSNNYVDIIAPSIVINDEVLSNNIHNRPTLALCTHEQNNNFPTINSPSDEYCSYSDQINGNVLCLSNNVINLDEVPLSALRPKSRDLLSKRLNAIKVILSENGSPRDWRGVLNSIGSSDVINNVQSKSDPMSEVLQIWKTERKVEPTIGNLQRILGIIDRWDVVDDANDFFVDDAKIHLDSVAKQTGHKTSDHCNISIEEKEYPVIDESNLLTFDDVVLAKRGLPPQRYDAYLLFHNSDINFALDILDKMEKGGLKLCLKERDLIGGTFESDAIMRMISERCDRLIVIFSKEFFEGDNAANTFFVKFAQALGIEQRKRKIIPCMKEPCKVPPSLSFYFTLMYREPTPYFNFWQRMYESIQNVRVSSQSTMPRITITEIDSPSTVLGIEAQPQPQQATIQCKTDLDVSNLSKKKLRAKSKSPKSSSPNTPTSLKKLLHFPKIGSQSTISSSMWTLGVTDQIFDKENERCHSSLSLNNSSSSPTPAQYKKTKWFKKLLSPSSAYKLSAESDSSVGMENANKKKKWYRKRFHSRNKNCEATAQEI